MFPLMRTRLIAFVVGSLVANGSHVLRSHAGELIEKIEFPSRPINCILGGRKQPMLYTTCFDGVYQLPINRYPRIAKNPDADYQEDLIPIETVDDVVYHTVEPDSRPLFADIHRPQTDDVISIGVAGQSRAKSTHTRSDEIPRYLSSIGHL